MIRVLDSFIADKIAAGEVIERPVSAVKELIENSIDAGASSIIIEIKNPSSYIRITDDGSGISPDEIETAFLRHATSKISKVTDLDNIRSLGFRGEALASISAVSRLTIVSKTANEISGTKMILHAGKAISKEMLGSNKGTTIVVEDLFYNTPARRKFMKSDARESSAITELVQQYAVCYPNIRFMMINKGETVFSTDGSGDAGETIKKLYPDKAHASLISLAGVGVRGYVSDPGTTLSSKKGQLFYVNGRLVSSKLIEKALTDGYGGRIFSGYPVAILFIDEDPVDIDVNIHPGKKEILFLHPEDVSARISSAVLAALSTEQAVPKAEIRIHETEESKPLYEASYYPGSIGHSEDDSSDASVREGSHAFRYAASSAVTVPQPTIREFLGNIDRDANKTLDSTDSQVIENNEHSIVDFDSMLIKGYFFDTYIIAEASDVLYVFDQHAAHERIFYEKLMDAYNSKEKLRQALLTPVIINVSADVYELRAELFRALNEIGYYIDDFGSGSFIIREIPSFMNVGEAEEFAASFCDYHESGAAINNTVIDKLIMKSCKSAVKGGDRLSDMEIKTLIKELSLCDNPYSCPHGRPTFIRITRYDVERAFKRK